ncbi:MAG: hypothetical protein IPN86_18725 [Saprospiraceae bacterium]|nr:hypothetical protein [Saprospiraceae bacterium]
MDRRELESKLVAFCKACESADVPVKIEGTSEAYPGASNNSYFVHIKGLDWADNKSCSDMLDIILPILYSSLEKMTIQHIFALNIYNSTDSMNCHYPMTYQEYSVAC